MCVLTNIVVTCTPCYSETICLFCSQYRLQYVKSDGLYVVVGSRVLVVCQVVGVQ